MRVLYSRNTDPYCPQELTSIEMIAIISSSQYAANIQFKKSMPYLWATAAILSMLGWVEQSFREAAPPEQISTGMKKTRLTANFVLVGGILLFITGLGHV